MRQGRHGGRHFGPRGGRWKMGPFEVDWSMDREERGGRKRRVFDSGELKLVLLRLISDEPRHGYDLIRAIETLTGGAYAPSPGVIYPTVTLLQDMGLIEETGSEGARKAFAVTPEGAMHLEERREEVEAIFARLAAMGEARDRPDAMAVRRAMHNLRTVLRNRLMRGEMDEKTVDSAIALIDETARKIERL